MGVFNKIRKGGTNLYKMSLYITSYIPIFLMIFINHMNTISFEEIINSFLRNWIFWSIIVLIFVICGFVLCDFLKQLKNTNKNYTKPIKLSDKKLQSNESEVINYFITYLIPILTLNPYQWTSIISNSLLIMVVGIYFVKNNLLSFNILLIILNFSIYKDQYSNIYITKANLSEIAIKKLEAYQYRQTNVFYIPKK
ncbi:hypothetical protein [Staphylococcus saprophyticus]|uniref:hypothetical protein n=1 Tax=Staphylococcus saprophyticus TaxID=29385 RepID=UPI00384EE617